MPIKDHDARRKYFRDYMQRRRAGEEPNKADDRRQAEIDALNERMRTLDMRLAQCVRTRSDS